MLRIAFLVVAIAIYTVDAFVVQSAVSSGAKASSSQLLAFPDIFSSADESTLSAAQEAARTKFWFYFLAGSGAGGIGAGEGYVSEWIFVTYLPISSLYLPVLCMVSLFGYAIRQHNCPRFSMKLLWPAKPLELDQLGVELR